jgi:6-pyruvoyltetrahydropterin/6-carboxytetrahydropterin synthase
MFTIGKRFAFSAAHQLTHLPQDHPCSRLHGHNYEVEFVLASSTLDQSTGFVFDYRRMDILKDFIDAKIDHQHLNVVMGDGDGRATTAEALALYFYHVAMTLLPLEEGTRLVVVRVSETPKTWAEYREDALDKLARGLADV